MKANSLTLVLFLFFIFGHLQAKSHYKNTDTLKASALKPFGRTLLNRNGQLELISSAVHFGFKFKGNSFKIFASLKNQNEHNFLQYEIDGVYQRRILIDGKNSGPITIEVNGNDEHTVWIYKATEAHTGPILIESIVASNIKPINNPKLPLIEFIGNSITCGAAADPSEIPCGTGAYQDQHNAYMAYGPSVARKLSVNYLLSSVSGIGIYRTWNEDGPSMPAVYENIDFLSSTTTKWNFNTYTPTIVSIALGTNDLSYGDGKTPRKPFEEDVFVSHYIEFIKLIKSKYPSAKIALLSSPMVRGTQRNLLENCLTRIKKSIDSLYSKDKKVSIFLFPEMEAHGCTGHPNVADHQILAEQLYPFYRDLLKTN